MKLWEFNRTNVIITLKNGVVVCRHTLCYFQAEDGIRYSDM